MKGEREDKKGWYWNRPFNKPAISPQIVEEVLETKKVVLATTTRDEMEGMIRKMGTQEGHTPPKRIKNSKNNKKSRVRWDRIRGPHVENMQGRGLDED